MPSIIYLHGLLSSSKSQKAEVFRKTLGSFGTFYAPDFYPQQWEFEKMTCSYLLQKLTTWVHYDNEPIILVGSSFGGLNASRYVQKLNNDNKVVGLVLLAPALNYLRVLEERMNPQEWVGWEKDGFVPVHHPAWEGNSKWSYSFVEDLRLHHFPQDEIIQVPTLLIHGTSDDIIPVSNSQLFVKHQQNLGADITAYYPEGGNHTLSNVLGLTVDLTTNFVQQLLSSLPDNLS